MDNQLRDLLRSPDIEDNVQAELILSAIPLPDQLSLLTPLLADESAACRCTAVSLLSKYAHDVAIDHIVPLLFDDNPAVRMTVLDALHSLPAQKLSDLFVEILLLDPDPDVRCWAGLCLGCHGDLSHLDALLHVRDNDAGLDYEGRPVATIAQSAINSIQCRHSGQQ